MNDSGAIGSEDRYLGTREAAKLMNVGESTVKRWVNQCILPAELTIGGHRKIRLRDLQRVVQERNLPRAGLETLRPPPDLPAFAEQFYLAVTAADPPHAQRVLQAAAACGVRIARLGDAVVAPTMARVGHGWEDGTLDIYQEHRGTHICVAALQMLRPSLPWSDDDAPLALGGGPEGDHYVVANLLVELTLLEEGWRVENVGPNTPLPSLRRAVRERRPRLVWLSCSHLADVEAFVGGFAGLYQDAREAGAALMVGGRALGEEVRRRITFTHHGDTLEHLVAAAREVRGKAE